MISASLPEFGRGAAPHAAPRRPALRPHRMHRMNPYAPPTADQAPVVWGPSASAQALRRLRWLAGGVGLVGLLSSLGAITQGSRLLTGAPEKLPGPELVSLGLMIFVAALYTFTAWALWTRRPFARVLGVVSVILSVCACPTGTLLTIWGLWVLTRPSVVALFNPKADGDEPPAGLG